MLIALRNVDPASWTTPSTRQHCRSTSPKDDQPKINTEGINGRLKGHDLDLGDPKNRLAHGRVAQTILVALLVTVANDHFLDQWRHTHQPPDKPDTSADIFEIPAEQADRMPPPDRSRPPPIP